LYFGLELAKTIVFCLISDDVIIIFQVMYKLRIITKQLKKLTENFPVVVVSGARQVGKSTLLQHVFPDIDTIVFDPVTDVGAAKSDPDVFLDNHPTPLILDEIQYAPTLTAAFASTCLDQGSATLRLDQDRENRCDVLS
jgi:predicted AAA+ superfamily ATPase